jgi:predicted PurR-regulated permease PerM
VSTPDPKPVADEVAPPRTTDPPTSISVPAWLPPALRLTIVYVLGTLALLWFLSQVRDLLGLVLLAAFFSLALEPAVNGLHRRGWSRGAATATLLLGAMGFFLILGLSVIPIMVRNIDQIAEDVPGWIDDVNEFTQREFDVQLIPDTAIDPSQSGVGVAKNFVADYGGALVGAVGGLAGAIFAVFTIALFAFYMTSNAPKIRRSVVSLLRPERQRDVLWAWNVAIEKTGGYLYQRILLAVINSSLMLIVMLLAGIPFAVPLAVFTGFTAAFIPIVGTYLAGIVPIVVALAAAGAARATILLAWIVIYQQLENYLLEPRLSKRTMDLNPGIALGAALAGGSVGGLIGAFFALPTAAAIQAFITTYATRYEVEDTELTRVDEAAQRASASPPPADKGG